MEKRYEYWGKKDGVPQKLFTRWFKCEHNQGDIQYKGFKGNTLLNEYR